MKKRPQVLIWIVQTVSADPKKWQFFETDQISCSESAFIVDDEKVVLMGESGFIGTFMILLFFWLDNMIWKPQP